MMEESPFHYRITGKQSVERLDPLLRSLVPNSHFCNALDLKSKSERSLSFVWETTCEKDVRAIHQNAIVLNKLHNSQIIESKASFASLQLLISYPMLETRVASNAGIVEHWATQRWGIDTVIDTTDRDWWVVKASQGNGGRDVWVFNSQNYRQVIQELPYQQEYVIQRYVNDPMLFRGKKFHFRCYSTMSATGMAMVYQKAFILSAGLDFDYNDDDVRKHVTNLSVNKRFVGHPGQVPCHLPEEYPEIYNNIQIMWSAVVEAALPYMAHQSSPLHFEFFGIDVIADASGGCWLIEANRLPGLESSKNNKQEEDTMYDEMMKSLLCIVLNPVIGVKEQLGSSRGLWDVVRTRENSESTYQGESCWTNLIKWRAFTKASREKFLAEYA